MRPCAYPVEALLPHARPMILIDEVVGWEPERLTAAVTVRSDAPFFVADRGIPAHVALEWMAQTCGACIGREMVEAGKKVHIGLLLGTRNFRATVPWFKEGERFVIRVSITFRDAEMGVFDCAVTRDEGGEPVATAQLTTYQSKDDANLIATIQERR